MGRFYFWTNKILKVYYYKILYNKFEKDKKSDILHSFGII